MCLSNCKQTFFDSYIIGIFSLLTICIIEISFNPFTINYKLRLYWIINTRCYNYKFVRVLAFTISSVLNKYHKICDDCVNPL